MARRSRSSAPARSPAKTQSRSATTAAAPTSMARAPAPPAPTQMAAPQQPGLFAQMATTAAGVAVGSAMGRVLSDGVSSMFSGSESEQPAPAAAQPHSTYYASQEQHGSTACQADAKAFTNCLETNNNDVSSCQFYLDMLKQCQSFSSQKL